MTTRSLATGAISPSATALGTAFAVSCLLHVAALGASLIVPWPIYVPPVVAVLPVELVETASDVAQAPSVVPAAAPVARRDLAPVALRAVPVHRLLPAPPESVGESRDTDGAEPAPAEQVVHAAQPAEAAAAPAAPGAAPALAPPVGPSVAAFAESAGEMAASLTQSTRTPQSSGSAAATGPVAAIQPNSFAAPRITQAARPSGGYQVRPTYPPAARRAGAEGTTLLRVHVLDDGRIGQVQVERSAGHVALDQAAAEAVRKWHFEPARSGSETVAVWVLIPVEFRLRSGL